MKKFIPYSHDEIRTSLASRLLEQGVIGQNDLYPGSNSMQIIDTISYLGSLINTNTTYGVNEMILGQATRRKNVLKLARQLGYEPQRKLSYIYTLRLRVKETGRIVLNTYTRFENGGYYYYYLGTPIDRQGYEGEVFEIQVKEGILLHYLLDVGLSFIIDNGNITSDVTSTTGRISETYFDIDYKDIEEDGIEIWVSEPPYTDNIKWDKREFNLDISEHQVNQFNNSFVAIRNIDRENLRIYFDFVGTGRVPEEGSYVNAVILVSNAEDGLAVDKFTTTDPTLLNIELTDYFKIYRYGSEESSIDDIKEQAPMFHSSAYRAITKDDYRVMLETNSFVESVSVWGGDEIFPPVLGHVWVSTLSDRLSNSKFINDGNIWQRKFTDFATNLDELDIMYVSDVNVETILEKLDNYKIITLQTHHEQPKFVRMNYNISLINKALLTPALKETIVNTTYDFFRNKYELFNSNYYNSTLIRELDKIVGDYNGIVCNLETEIALTQKDLKGVASLDEFWAIGEEERYLNTCGICLNDELASDYAFDINIYLAYPSEEFFDYTNNTVIYNKLPQIDTTNFIQNVGVRSPSIDNVGSNVPSMNPTPTAIELAAEVNRLRVAWTEDGDKYRPTDNWLSYKIYFNGHYSGKYNILNTTKQKYIHIQLRVQSAYGDIGLDMYDKSGLYKSFFTESAQILKLAYPSENINFIRNTLPIINKVTFK